MNRLFDNTFAALAAVVLAFISTGTVVSVPPAPAQGIAFATELA